METSLHRELKNRYAGSGGETEVRVDGFRIDAVRQGTLIEIQHGPLGAIRDKIQKLCKKHRVLIVKPLLREKTLVKLASVDGEIVSRRRSPKRGTPLDLFDELIHFTRAFPHKNLTIELLELDVEEFRCPGHGRRRRWRRNDHITIDQHIVATGPTHRIATKRDLLALLPQPLPREFHTGHLATAWQIPRFRVQRIVYTLRQMRAIHAHGKQGNAILYRRSPRRAA
jgi:hypothetical protein